MKKPLLFLFTSFCLATKIYSQEWIKFNSTEGKFSVYLPVQPKMQKDSSKAFKTTAYVSESLGYIFGVGWIDYEKSYSIDEQKELESIRDNLINKIKGKLMKSTYTNFRGFKCLDFTAKSGSNIWTSMVFLSNRRLYQLYTKTFIGEDDEDGGDQEEMKFYNSFEIRKD